MSLRVFHKASLLLAFCCWVGASLALTEHKVIYVQTSKGSFNHQAITLLLRAEKATDTGLVFSGTPASTFEQAAASKREAFVALRNSLVPGHLIGQTVQALTRYRVVAVTGAIRTPIHQCLLRAVSAVERKLPLRSVVSHPAALKQINLWIRAHRVESFEVPEGTAAAAEKLSSGSFADDVGVVGSCLLAQTYPNLVVVQPNIEDNSTNATLFGRLRVEAREQPISEEQAKAELELVILKASGLLGEE